MQERKEVLTGRVIERDERDERNKGAEARDMREGVRSMGGSSHTLQHAGSCDSPRTCRTEGLDRGFKYLRACMVQVR